MFKTENNWKNPQVVDTTASTQHKKKAEDANKDAITGEP